MVVDFHPRLLGLIPANAKVIIEVGCGKGAMGEQYKAINPQVRYIGIESNPELAAIASTKIDLVLESFEQLSENLTEEVSPVECLIYGDFQLNGSEPLFRYAQHLKSDGLVIGYSKNLQYWQNLAIQLQGKNPDFPALSLFQLREILETEANFSPLEIQADYPSLDPASQAQFSQFYDLALPLMQHLGMQPEQIRTLLLAQGFLFRASKTPLNLRKLFIHTFISAPVGCDRVRVLEPDYFSATTPGNRILEARVGEAINLNAGYSDEERVMVWQRALLLYPQDIQKQKLLLKNGYLIVAEHDDDPYYWQENADNKFLLFWSSHCVQTSTPTLATHLQQWNPNVTIFANQLAYLPPARSYPKTSKVTLFFGALNRQSDWEPLMPGLNRILKKFQQVQVQVIHDRTFFEALTTKNKHFTAWCAYEEYQRILHTCDIGILPLNDTQFNRMKSDLKFLEHAGHGVVALASPIVYADSIVEGETGMIYRSLTEFEAKLIELIRNSQLRQRLAQNAYNWVRSNRLMSQHFHQRREWYLEMRSQLPRLNAELRDRCPQLFE